MSPDIQQGNPVWKQELDSLLAAYDSESFTRSILHVYARDCPVAVERLRSTIKTGNLEQARGAIHSLTNIMGVVGPASSRLLLDGLSANLKNGELKTAAIQALELEVMVKDFLINIQTWLEVHSRAADSASNASRDNT